MKNILEYSSYFFSILSCLFLSGSTYLKSIEKINGAEATSKKIKAKLNVASNEIENITKMINNSGFHLISIGKNDTISSIRLIIKCSIPILLIFIILFIAIPLIKNSSWDESIKIFTVIILSIMMLISASVIMLWTLHATFERMKFTFLIGRNLIKTIFLLLYLGIVSAYSDILITIINEINNHNDAAKGIAVAAHKFFVFGLLLGIPTGTYLFVTKFII